MKHIAIIPARSGSKGIKDKNIKILNGKPLMAYSIEAALNSGIFDCVHVSTDSEKYAFIAKEYGADVPFLRSKENAGDKASSWETVLEVLDKYKAEGQSFDLVTLLQPTSPLRNVDDIKNAYNELIAKNAKAVISICEVDHSPLLSGVLPSDYSLNGFIKKDKNTLRQELPAYYRINGAIYMTYTEFLMNNKDNLYVDGAFAYIMSKERSVDIDTEQDFEFAEYLVSKQKR